jgi:AcrR family transcriptional regulator
MNGIAARARTSKPVLYRRWPSRAGLVLAAIRHNFPEPDELPNTGDLRSDLFALLRQIAHFLGDLPQDATNGLLTEALSDPQLWPLFHTHIAQSQYETAITTILDRAATRKEINRDRLTPRIRRMPLDLLRNEYLISGPIADTTITEIVDDIILPLLRAAR